MMKLSKLLAALALLLFAAQANAASLLPNGKQQFWNTDGTLCAGCKVYFFIPNTSTPKDTWTDSGATVLNTNPVVLDSYGSAIIYGIGTYRQILKDPNNNTLWDTVTADQVSLTAAWSGLSSGSANVQTVTNANFSLTDGAQVTFLAGISNTGATTLNVSGTGAISVVTDTSSGPQALGGGEIVVGNVVSVVYDATAGVFHIVTPTPIQSFKGAVFFNGTITPTILAADQNDWTPTGGFSTANTLRISSSANINITGLAGGSAGRTAIFHNIGTFTITFVPNSTSSAAGNRFLLSAPVVLRPNDDAVLQYDSISAGWRRFSPHTANPTGASFKNLVITNGATPNNQVIGTADEVVVEDTNGVSVRLRNVSCTADVTVTGTFTSSTGSLDAGGVASSTWYSYWFIYNPATNTPSCLLSTSTTSPTLPSGFTFSARVSWNRTDGSSHFNRVTQRGRRAQYVVTSASPTAALPMIGTTGSATFVAMSVSNFVPPTTSEIFIWMANSNPGTAVVSPNNQTSVSSPVTNPSPLFSSDGATAAGMAGSFVLETTNIYAATSAPTLNVFALGWTDNL